MGMNFKIYRCTKRMTVSILYCLNKTKRTALVNWASAGLPKACCCRPRNQCYLRGKAPTGTLPNACPVYAEELGIKLEFPGLPGSWDFCVRRLHRCTIPGPCSPNWRSASVPQLQETWRLTRRVC